MNNAGDWKVYAQELGRRIVQMEETANRALEDAQRLAKKIALTRDVPVNPAKYEERWQPRYLYQETGYVVRVVRDEATNEEKIIAILITSENIDLVEIVQKEWQERHPDIYETYNRGPRARVEILADGMF